MLCDRGLFLWTPVTVTTRKEFLWRHIFGHRLGFSPLRSFCCRRLVLLHAQVGRRAILWLFTGLRVSGGGGLLPCVSDTCPIATPGSCTASESFGHLRVFFASPSICSVPLGSLLRNYQSIEITNQLSFLKRKTQ